MNQIDDRALRKADRVEGALSSPLLRARGLDLQRSQRTLLRTVNCVGVGLHTGRPVSLTLKPARAGAGIQFRRTDLAGAPFIPARFDHVVDTAMCTTLGTDKHNRIATVEHLMAALAGCHVDNVIVEVSGPEVPVMDGSAQPFVFLIECAGLIDQAAPKTIVEILKPVKVEDGDKSAEIVPADRFSVDFEIEFASSAIARQAIRLELVNGTFNRELARARTFGFVHEVEQLRAAGLALGGSLDNAVVVEGDKVLNADGLRYDDEFVRHKALDAVGDLYLAGGEICGAYRGVRAGHNLTNRLLRTLFADATAYRVHNPAEAQDNRPVRRAASA